MLGEFTFADMVPVPVNLAVNSPKHRPLAQVVEIGTARTGSEETYAFSDMDTDACTVIATGYPPQAASVTVSFAAAWTTTTSASPT